MSAPAVREVASMCTWGESMKFGVLLGHQSLLPRRSDLPQLAELVKLVEDCGVEAIGTYDTSFLGGDAFLVGTPSLLGRIRYAADTIRSPDRYPHSFGRITILPSSQETLSGSWQRSRLIVLITAAFRPAALSRSRLG